MHAQTAGRSLFRKFFVFCAVSRTSRATLSTVIEGLSGAVVLVPPKQTVEVDLDTDNPGKLITHCHNTYHLEAGMPPESSMGLEDEEPVRNCL